MRLRWHGRLMACNFTAYCLYGRTRALTYATSALSVLYLSLPSLQVRFSPLFRDVVEPCKSLPSGSSIGAAVSAHQLPEDHSSLPQGSGYCSAKYRIEYVKNFRDSMTRYCTHESLTQLECFHTRIAADCVDTPAVNQTSSWMLWSTDISCLATDGSFLTVTPIEVQPL